MGSDWSTKVTVLRSGVARRAAIGLVVAIVVAGGATACLPVPIVLTLAVNTAADGNDASPGNNVCEVTPGAGDCSLRAAITESNAVAGRDSITIGPGIDPVLSIPGSNENVNATGDLDVTGDVRVIGGGATIDAGGIDRVVDVRSGKLTLATVELTGGHPLANEPSGLDNGGGAAIRAKGEVTLDRARLTGNTSGSSADGSAIMAVGARIAMTNTEVIGNTSESSGVTAAIVLRGQSQLNLSRSTISNPTQTAIKSDASNSVLVDATVFARQALSFNQSIGVVVRSTLVGSPGAAPSALLRQTNGSLHVGGSVLDLPSVQPGESVCSTIAAEVSSLGWNVASDTTCGFASNGDRQGDAVLLQPIADNGGPTQTFLPSATSPALTHIPWGTAGLCSGDADQRGVARPVGEACAAGSVEGVGPALAGLRMVVDTATDGVDDLPGDGVCASALTTCTLRAAIMEANASNSALAALADTVEIGPGINPVLSIAGADEDGSATGDLDVSGALLIEGGGATVNGGGLDRVFDITGSSTTLRNLVVVGGRASAVSGTAAGGGIRSKGAITIEQVTVRANTATGGGGGISGASYGGVTVVESDVDGNQAGATGGGIEGETVTVTRSLIRNNRAGATGGGIGATGPVAGAGATITDSTITGNSAFYGGAGVAVIGPLTVGTRLVRSTVADNHGSPSLMVLGTVCTRSCLTWSGVSAQGSILVGPPGEPVCDLAVVGPQFNVAPDGTCGASIAGAPVLGALANNGGPTLTHLPGTASVAINAIPQGTASLCDGAVSDQRGIARPQGAACDVGAVEQ